ncbi:MobC family plasmid mobilization relaxosome protein [Parerythrobacter lacustris]|uniref:MobC family plasmid mobilization relaxosome protein n=1 Tax=Parerythrobacter lacustris TaxID=2969984 RepID=UPI00214AA615
MASGTDKRQRTLTVTVRVTDDERRNLEELSSRAGLAMGAFVRAAALKDPGVRARRRPPVDHVAIRQLLGELGRVGNNLNQIARSLNTGEDIDLPELREALASYLPLRDAIFVALGKEPSGDHQGRKPSGT